MHSSGSGREDWREREAIGNLIKVVFFESGTIDPVAYDKALILTARNVDPRFAEVDDNLWSIAFRRAASEIALEREHEAVEARYRSTLATTNHQQAVPLLLSS